MIICPYELQGPSADYAVSQLFPLCSYLFWLSSKSGCFGSLSTTSALLICSFKITMRYVNVVTNAKCGN